MQYFIDSLSQYTIYEYLWFFMIYAVGGWCLEVCYHVVTQGKFVNRGFLNGPACPIYGFGMIIVIICLLPLRDNKLLMFAGSIVLATLLELVTGFLLEKLFHERWWDYSKEPFNFHGYICVKFSLEWGIACLIVVDVIHNAFVWCIKHFPALPGTVLLVICLLVLAADCVATVVTIIGFNKRLRLMNEIGLRIKSMSEAVGGELTDATLYGLEKSQQVKEQLDDTKERLDEKSAALRREMDERSAAVKRELDERSAAFKKELDEKRTENAARAEAELDALKARLERLRAPQARGQLRLLRAFPDMKNDKFSSELEQLKSTARELLKKKKAEKTQRK